MTKKQIEVVAEVFAGPLVAHNSIMLGSGGTSAKMARIFFDAREKLGIHGYISKEQAVQILSKK